MKKTTTVLEWPKNGLRCVDCAKLSHDEFGCRRIPLDEASDTMAENMCRYELSVRLDMSINIQGNVWSSNTQWIE